MQTLLAMPKPPHHFRRHSFCKPAFPQFDKLAELSQIGSGFWLSEPKVVAEDRKHLAVGRHQIFSELLIVVIEYPFEFRSSFPIQLQQIVRRVRSEERRVGKEWRFRW